MNGRTSKLLRKVASAIGLSPKYIKHQFKAMTPEQQAAYKLFVKTSLIDLESRKEVLHGKNLPKLQQADSPTG